MGAIRRHQQRQLRDLLKHAQASVPIQQERIQSTKLLDFTDIPPIGKLNMMAKISDGVDHDMLSRLGSSAEELDAFCDGFYERDAYWFCNHAMLAESTGTSGTKGLFFRSRSELEQSAAIGMARSGSRPLLRILKHRPLRRAIVLMRNSRYATWQGLNDASHKYARFVDIRIFGNLDDPERLVHDLNAFDPHHLGSVPMYLQFLSQYKLQGKLKINPQTILTGGSTFTPADFDLVKSAFPGARVTNRYASTECSPMATSCSLGQLHLFSDAALLEPVGEDEEATPLDEFSHHILITSLLRRFQPIIRYRLMDEVKISSQACGCGSPFPVIEVRGRSNPEFPATMNSGDEGVVRAIDLQKCMSSLPMIREFQVNCHTKNQLDMLIFVHGNDLDVAAFRQRHQEEISQKFSEFLREKKCDQYVELHYEYLKVDLSKQKRQAFNLHI